MKAKRVWSAVLCAGLALSMCVNAGAAAQNDELRAAASYVSEQGVMVGDQNGDMALDQTLSRTELAVILTRITVNPEHLEAEREHPGDPCLLCQSEHGGGPSDRGSRREY